MDTRVTNQYVKVTGPNGESAVSDFYQGARVESPHTVETIDVVDNTLTVLGLKSETVDSNLDNIAKLDITFDVLCLEDEPRTPQSDKSVETLIGKGTVIITGA